MMKTKRKPTDGVPGESVFKDMLVAFVLETIGFLFSLCSGLVRVSDTNKENNYKL